MSEQGNMLRQTPPLNSGKSLGAATPTGQQCAALPLQRVETGRIRLLMITSPGTGRWIIPKGWLIDATKPWETAEIEAMEEAGACGAVTRHAIGTYRYLKHRKKNPTTLCSVAVHLMLVRELRKSWKEQHQRVRRWFELEDAANLVDEPELARILLNLSQERPGKLVGQVGFQKGF